MMRFYSINNFFRLIIFTSNFDTKFNVSCVNIMVNTLTYIMQQSASSS